MDDHIPKGELALFAFNPAAVTTERARAIRRHTASCAECQADLDFVAVREDDLDDGDVWQPIVGSATYDALMSYGARIAAEDREADELLTGALTAIAYIKEAAAAGTLTTEDLQAVRAFLRRVERQPELVFAPPPKPR